MATQGRKRGRMVNTLISVDWGSSSLRLSCVDIQSAQVLSEIASRDGIKNFAHLVPEERQQRLLGILDEQIDELIHKNDWKEKPPVYVSGMAISSLGILNLPYFKLPIINFQNDFVRSTMVSPSGYELFLYSGWQTNDDVMRGEETQIIGALQKSFEDSLFILPGTHSKHAMCSNGQINAFETFMTGELFEILSQNSMLASSIEKVDPTMMGPHFEEGCKAGKEMQLLHAIFTVRSRSLLDGLTGQEAFSYLSGLLIGSELSNLKPEVSNQLYLIGSQTMNNLYQRALDYLFEDQLEITTMESSRATALGHLFYHQNHHQHVI